uniref:Putative secreted protein n=1 Tax=Ixodes ricinus TaxID=34613 RepID=A0A6B0UAS5_IXORI
MSLKTNIVMMMMMMITTVRQGARTGSSHLNHGLLCSGHRMIEMAHTPVPWAELFQKGLQGSVPRRTVICEPRHSAQPVLLDKIEISFFFSERSIKIPATARHL